MEVLAPMQLWRIVLGSWACIYSPVEVRRLMGEAEARRTRATYDTGSITEAEACSLWALADFLRARVVVEVGTFIGTSTTALATAAPVEAVYTCDVSNDCGPKGGVITSYPRQTSTAMLRDLVERGVRADLCFFDGVLSAEDVDLLEYVTHLRTVYAFHDYNYGPKQRIKRGVMTLETMPRKGIGNVELLRPRLPRHVLIPPQPETTLALLVPEAL